MLVEKEELAEGQTATPEQRAALEYRLKALVARIGDPSVKTQYETELRQVLWERTRRQMRELGGGGGSHGAGSGRRGADVVGRRRNNTQLDWRVQERARMQGKRPPPGPQLASTAVASNELANRIATVPPRDALLLHTLLNHPWLIQDQAEEIAELGFLRSGAGGAARCTPIVRGRREFT